MNTRKLKIAAGSSYSRQKRAWRLAEADYAASITLDAEALDYKELHLLVDTLTGNLTLNCTPVTSSFVGDLLFVYLEADSTERTFTFGTNLAGTVSTVTIPASTKVCLMFSFDGESYVYFGAASGTFSSPLTYSSATGITAFATGGQASATQLTEEFNEVSTVATAGDSVKLPAAVAGLNCIVFNDGAATLALFPATGDTINDGSANASISIEPGEMVHLRAINSTNWEGSNQVLTLSGKATIGGDLLFGGILRSSGTPQTLTGAGAVNLTTFATLLVTTGANALTLAAGSEGQFKFIRMKTDGGDGTLTVTNLQGGTTLTFNDAGDFVLLYYLDAKWHIIVNSGATLA